MNPINPARMNESRQSGNDRLTAIESRERDVLTANRARLTANALRGECHVEDAEAIHVTHRHGLAKWYQVNVLLSRSTLHPDIFERYEEEYDLELHKPQAVGGQLLLQYRVPEVEVNEAGTTENEWVDEQNELDDVDSVLNVSGVNMNTAAKLNTEGYYNIADLREASESELAKIEYVGEELAARIKEDV